jgi:hypothetical protein
MKTIRQHILTLKPEHRIAAFKNIGMNKVLEETCESPSSALNHAMNWTKTPEGSRYWTKIWDDLGAGTYFDAPQYTAEDFEAKAKEILHTAPPTKPNFGTERPATAGELEGLDKLTGGRTISQSTSQYEDMNTNKVKSIYVAGKMRGIPHFNFPAFDKARDQLISEGWEVVSPADIDRESGFDAMDMPADSDWNSVDGLEGFDLFESFDRDIAAIRKCDSIYMLKGWENSTGATAEHACAKWLLKEIIYENEAICEEAYRIQGGDRQQDYGSPSKNFDDIAGLWNSYIAASGTIEFEARDVAHMMILMKVSRNIHKPKRDNWVDIAGYAQCGGKVDEV